MKSKHYRNPFIIALAVIVVLFLAGLVGTPYLIDMGLERWIASRGPEIVQVENIDFNPFSGRLSMDNLVVESKSGRMFNISHAYLAFSWKQLFKKQLYLKELVLQETFMLVDQLEDRGLRVGGLILQELTGTGEKSDEPGWEVGIGHFELQNTRIEYDTPELAATYFIDQYTLTGLETWNRKKPVKMVLAGRINESPVRIRAEVKLLDADKSWKGNIVFENGSLSLISKVRGLQEYAPSGTIDLDLQLDAVMQEDGSITFDTEGTVALNTLQLRYEGYGLQQERIAWQGRVAGNIAAGQKPAATVDGELTGKGLALDSGAKSMQLLLGAFSWQGKAGFSQGADSSITLDVDGATALNTLQLQYEGYGLQQERIAWQGRVAGNIAAGQKPAATVAGKLAGTGLKLDSSAHSMQLLLAAFNWEGKAGISQQKDFPAVTMESELDGGGVSVIDQQNNVGLLGLEKFNIAGIQVAGLEDIRVSQVDLQNMRLVEKRNGAEKEAKETSIPLLQAAAVEISTIGYRTENNLTIRNIKLQEVGAFIHRNKEGKLQMLPALPGQPGKAVAEKPKPEAAGTAGDADAFKFRLDTLEVSGKSAVHFEDESLRQPFRTIFHLTELQLTDINTAEAATPGRFSLKGQVEDYGTIAFGGTLKLSEKPVTLDMKGTISALDMVPFSSYTGKTIGYNVANGQMDADIAMNIDRGKMDGNFNLKMRKLKVAKATPDKVAEIDNQLNAPLGTALSMLRDKKDEINLKLELQGDITNPKFGIQDAINQALAKAMKYAAVSFLKYTLQPFGTYITIAQVVGKAGKEMAKVRLDPIIFPAGEIRLDDTATQYLGKVQEVLVNRPKLRIELCGKAVAKDRVALVARRQAAQEKLATTAGKKQEAAAEAITVSDEVLLDFARERTKLVKESLVEQHGIDHERIYLCLPEMEEKPEKEPYVELFLD